MVSGVSVQVSAFGPLASTRLSSSQARFRLLTGRQGPDTRNLKPIYPVAAPLVLRA